MLAVGYLGTLFRAQGGLTVSLLATDLVAVVFAPLRDRLQRGINRLMYAERDEPCKALSRLVQRLEATLAPDAVLPTVMGLDKEAPKLPYAAVELRQDGAHSTPRRLRAGRQTTRSAYHSFIRVNQWADWSWAAYGLPARGYLEAKVRHESGVAIVDLHGEISAFAEDALNTAYSEAEGHGPGVILLNFGDVNYINSTGIALIVGLLARARASDRRLLACCLSDHYVEIFRITRLADFMNVFPDEASAISDVS